LSAAWNRADQSPPAKSTLASANCSAANGSTTTASCSRASSDSRNNRSAPQAADE
jgi:hypothetical protein